MSIQALLSKLNEAWQSHFALTRLKKRGKLPPHIRNLKPPRYWKEKGRRTAKAFYVRNDGWHWTGQDELLIGRNVKVPFQHGRLWVGKQGRLEILHDTLSGKWVAHFPVDAPSGHLRRIAGGAASLDLGICNLTALTSKGRDQWFTVAGLFLAIGSTTPRR